MSDCIFCSIVAEESPAYRLYEDEQSRAFLDVDPATRGHTRVVPKSHHETTPDMSESLAGDVFRTVHRVAGALESVCPLQGYNVVQSNGVAAGQEVFHAHVHIIPRYEDDTVALEWCTEGADETTRQDIADAVCEELASRS